MKKNLFIIAIAACLVAIVACGSLAYFTGSSTVTNKFMVASSDDPQPGPGPDEIFGISLTETTPEGGETDEGNTYDNIEPGTVVDKKPVIKNTGKFDQWVRITLTLTKGDKWLAADDSFTAANLFDKLVAGNTGSGYVSTDWVRVDPDDVDGDNNLVYTFYYNARLTPEDDPVALFEKVTVPSCLENDDMKELSEFNIIIKADAIQADNTGASAKETFESTDPIYWED